MFDSLCESLIMDYGVSGHLYSQLEKFGQEIGENVVLVRSQNRFVLPFMHITFVKEYVLLGYRLCETYFIC